ncbi:glycosyltransferase family 2 protein [Bacillus sp. RG28]|uniref:Glycosyltransferase family 2 protein n=1 Tax=Gottfriedia endophytica TaxID=2820819 RepID=A0A940NM19_9BACI|nr:glycosyltransferase family 2 protein [Gottfriedia endophytica]MBP0725016.1 glycosyltransferase family 2 protein [Gottfriedia endophytica]
MKISLVVPCYNEEKNIQEFYDEVTNLLSTIDCTYEIVLVNDGSKDNTLVKLQTISLRDERVKYISFSRNFGKEAGMLAGLTYASGDAVIILDADLQHPPSLIPQLLEGYNEGFDQVIAKRNRTGDKVVRTAFSKLYYKIMNKFVDIELTDGVGDFRLLSRKAVNSLLSLQEYNRFSKGLFSWIGYKTKVIEYENVLRNEGESSWSFSSLLNYGIDGVISFNNRPLRMLIYLGLFVMIAGLVYILCTFFQITFSHKSTPGYFTTISAILLLGGIQLISLGVIGEYIGRIYYETKRRPQFIIDETNVEIPMLEQVAKK